ncbi:MAG: methyltransferase domain-containing protein [Chloroflexi bacterium]|nr:methyltransferase domain-containing protein [Chloroflexota bacterium]
MGLSEERLRRDERSRAGGGSREAEQGVDLDALTAELRERVKRKREAGVYGPEVAKALEAPLPGGAPLPTDDGGDPLVALAAAVESEVAYDPRSRKPFIGPALTFARRALIGILRWYLHEIVHRQDRINEAALRALRVLSERESADIVGRVEALEEAKRREAIHQGAVHMDYELFAERFGGLESQVREQAERFVRRFAGCKRVLDIGSGRGTFLTLCKERGIGAYGVDLEERLVRRASDAGLEAYRLDAEEHLRSLPDGALDGIFAVHFAEHVLPGHLFEILRECKRTLRSGAYCIMATPNPSTLTVGADSFWLDPTHRKPLPPEALRFYLQISGFEPVEIETYNPSETRLSEDGLSGAALANVRLLNQTLFGDRDYAVIGRKP